MRQFVCRCDARLFFDNSQCLSCNREVDCCPACQQMTALMPTANGGIQCGHSACNTPLVKCQNYHEYNVCNRYVRAIDAAKTPEAMLCDCCEFNQVIPDLSVSGNLKKWAKLEAAKRRLLDGLDLVQLPYRFAQYATVPQLRFDFKADIQPKVWLWWTIAEKEQVFTGHANGLITINIREANPIEREKMLVRFGEAHRTLIGHFRHEIAHYYFEVLVRDHDVDRCKAVFGDHENPTYQEALETYYQNGPLPDWRTNFVSAYATMHPWEDFAEMFATYLNMMSAVHTAHCNGLSDEAIDFADVDAMMSRYMTIGVAMNEVTRCMGLLDVVPEMLVAPVREKMRYIHELVTSAPNLTQS